MSWQVDLARDAKKELARLPTAAQKRVARVLLSLEEEPFPAGCKKLKNRDGSWCSGGCRHPQTIKDCG